MPKLISSKIVASNVTSQFRLYILDEDHGRVEVRRAGRGWGHDLTVAAVRFSNEAAFEEFQQSDSFSAVKYVLIQSALEQKELRFPRSALWSNVHHSPSIGLTSPAESHRSLCCSSGHQRRGWRSEGPEEALPRQTPPPPSGGGPPPSL